MDAVSPSRDSAIFRSNNALDLDADAVSEVVELAREATGMDQVPVENPKLLSDNCVALIPKGLATWLRMTYTTDGERRFWRVGRS